MTGVSKSRRKLRGARQSEEEGIKHSALLPTEHPDCDYECNGYPDREPEQFGAQRRYRRTIERNRAHSVGKVG